MTSWSERGEIFTSADLYETMAPVGPLARAPTLYVLPFNGHEIHDPFDRQKAWSEANTSLYPIRLPGAFSCLIYPYS